MVVFFVFECLYDLWWAKMLLASKWTLKNKSYSRFKWLVQTWCSRLTWQIFHVNLWVFFFKLIKWEKFSFSPRHNPKLIPPSIDNDSLYPWISILPSIILKLLVTLRIFSRPWEAFCNGENLLTTMRRFLRRRHWENCYDLENLFATLKIFPWPWEAFCNPKKLSVMMRKFLWS